MKRYKALFQQHGYVKHLLFLAVFAAYMFFANDLYEQFLVRYGKPARTDIALPSATDGSYAYKLSGLRTIHENGQEVFEMRGFAYDQQHPKQKHRITLVLTTPDGNMAFPTSAVSFPSMIKSSPSYQPGTEHAEFRVLISKHALLPGNYQIGLLLEDPGGGQPVYLDTKDEIEKTNNKTFYKPGN